MANQNDPNENKSEAKESVKALQAFEEYWALGPERSIQKVSQKLAKSVPLIKRWSAQFNWQGRIRERQQAENEAVRKAEIEQAIKRRQEASEKRLARTRILQSSAALIIKKAELEKLEVDDARGLLALAGKLIIEGLKAERLELGESTKNITSITPPKPLQEMTDAELEEYKAKITTAVTGGNPT